MVAGEPFGGHLQCLAQGGGNVRDGLPKFLVVHAELVGKGVAEGGGIAPDGRIATVTHSPDEAGGRLRQRQLAAKERPIRRLHGGRHRRVVESGTTEDPLSPRDAADDDLQHSGKDTRSALAVAARLLAGLGDGRCQSRQARPAVGHSL